MIQQQQTLPQETAHQSTRSNPTFHCTTAKNFLRGKPKKSGGTVCTNLIILHDEEIADIIIDMKDSIKAFNPKIGKHRIQHCDAVKLGYIMCLATKAEISLWAEFFQKQVEEILKTKVLLAISAAKINDGTGFIDDSTSKSSSLRTKRKKVEH